MSENSLTRATIFAAVFFAVSIAIGVGFVILNPGFGDEVLSLFNEQVVVQILSDSLAVLAFKIFLNNLSACLLLFLGGASLGLVTMLIISVNGLLIGVVTELVRVQQGALYVVAALVPHGIFEIPAVLISGGSVFSLHVRSSLNGMVPGMPLQKPSLLPASFSGLSSLFLRSLRLWRHLLRPQS